MVSNDHFGVSTRILVMAIVLSVILLFGGVVLLVLIHVCIVGRAFSRGFPEGTHVVERSSNGSCTSMSRDDINKLPCYDYIAEDVTSSPVDCAVCLENFKMGEKCRLLPICKHSFHAQCVDAWLMKTPICPICRTCADSWKGGSVSGEESRCFSDLSIELRGSQTTGSSHLSDIRIELSESLRIESDRHSDIGTEILGENKTVGSSQLDNAGTESGENQAANIDFLFGP
ncbi:RING-H2 finger protein ATL74-like isoform X1 [Juglans regia]|uniref:RING-type E3 ubiquitin transferase n=1 Tax=Juglans regia TaxID=51240 RepID=A0A2I4EU81_JUGRE|nr:RING-H2 finger protein ATL74-like isoform X1 [Juglans regia]